MIRIRGLAIGLLVASVSATVALSLMPSVPDAVESINDKWGHVVAYGVNSTLAAWAFPSVSGLRGALLGLVALGGGLELMQGVSPTRHASWQDAAANTVGICVGGALLWRRRYRASKERAV